MTNAPLTQCFYSQHAEDAIVLRAIGRTEKGTFVEVGCIDGRRFSNTLALEETGWTGLCVEAHPDYIELLRRNRPGSVVAHCAACDRDGGEVTLHASERGALSTLDSSRETEFRDRYRDFFSGFTPTPVPGRTLDSLLAEFGLEGPDVVSIDVDGGDLDVLRGFGVARHRPRVLTIEADTVEDVVGVEGVMQAAGYQPAIPVASNRIYFRDPADAAAAAALRTEVELTHTRHPLDPGGDEWVRAAILPREHREAQAHMREALDSCARQGLRRVAIYGAGRFTERAGPAIRSGPVEIACVIDDEPARWGARILGAPIVSMDTAVEQADRLDAVVLSSDAHQSRLAANAIGLWTRGVRVIPLHADAREARPARAG